MISWCSRDIPALISEVDELRAVLREAVEDREKELMEDMGRICKLGVTLPAWYYSAKALIGGSNAKSDK